MMSRRSILVPALWLAALLPAAASGEGEHGGGHALPLYAEELFWGFISNSTIMVWLAVAIIVLFCQLATRNMKLVPTGLQNFAEWAVGSLHEFLASLIGEKLVNRTFWFFGTIFFFILINNYMGLVPGVGTIGWDTVDSHGHEGFKPLLRGANADVNMTLAMASTFALLWFYWAISETSFKMFLAHIFAPKGKFKGIMLAMMIPVFLFVGVLEVVSIGIRPIALTFRLFGNIYAGEQTLETLMHMVPKWAAFAPALPFYFMELLVGFIQALVFTLLCGVFLKLICDHGDEEHH